MVNNYRCISREGGGGESELEVSVNSNCKLESSAREANFEVAKKEAGFQQLKNDN